MSHIERMIDPGNRWADQPAQIRIAPWLALGLLCLGLALLLAIPARADEPSGCAAGLTIPGDQPPPDVDDVHTVDGEMCIVVGWRISFEGGSSVYLLDLAPLSQGSAEEWK